MSHSQTSDIAVSSLEQAVEERPFSVVNRCQGRKKLWILLCVVVAVVISVISVILIKIFRKQAPIPPGTYEAYVCTSRYSLEDDGNVKNMSSKGMCLDDITFIDCPEKILSQWPNTQEKIKIMRMFKPCKIDENCDDARRIPAWRSIQKFVKANDVKILMGFDINDYCNLHSKEDEQEWLWTLEFMQMIGKERILAISFGNEADDGTKTQACAQEFWQHGYLDMIKQRVNDMDKAGLNDVKVTSVFTLAVLDNSSDTTKPFKDHLVLANTFLTNAFNTFGKFRWVWGFNVYPYWTSGQCDSYHMNSTARAEEMKADVGVLRERILNITGNHDDTLYMTETGWSSAKARDDGDLCKGYSTVEQEREYYKAFMNWDLSLPNGMKAPDLAFYFTMRDTLPEHFGLIAGCGDEYCKLQSSAVEEADNLNTGTIDATRSESEFDLQLKHRSRPPSLPHPQSSHVVA